MRTREHHEEWGQQRTEAHLSEAYQSTHKDTGTQTGRNRPAEALPSFAVLGTLPLGSHARFDADSLYLRCGTEIQKPKPQNSSQQHTVGEDRRPRDTRWHACQQFDRWEANWRKEEGC